MGVYSDLSRTRTGETYYGYLVRDCLARAEREQYARTGLGSPPRPTFGEWLTAHPRWERAWIAFGVLVVAGSGFLMGAFFFGRMAR